MKDESMQPPNTEFGLFNNPMVESARKQMSAKQLKNLQMWGEYMYNTTDFNATVGENNVPPFLESKYNDIHSLIQEGCHISLLSDDEKKIMEEIKGERWYEEYGYVKEDLDSIVTFK